MHSFSVFSENIAINHICCRKLHSSGDIFIANSACIYL